MLIGEMDHGCFLPQGSELPSKAGPALGAACWISMNSSPFHPMSPGKLLLKPNGILEAVGKSACDWGLI